MWKNMKISHRMTLSYMMVVAFLMIPLLVSLGMLSKVGDALQEFYTTSYLTVQNSWKGKRSLAALRGDLLQAALDTDETKTSSYVTGARAEFNTLNDAISDLESTYMGDKDNIKDLNNYASAATPMIEQLYLYAAQGDAERSYAYMRDNYLPVADSMRDLFDSMGLEADRAAQEKVDAANRLASTAYIVVVVLFVLTAGLSLVRTAPAHGMQYDIAGQGKADECSFRHAIFKAIDIWRNRQDYDEPMGNPLPKLYHEKRDDSERVRFSTPKKDREETKAE